MRLSPQLCAQHIGFMFKKHWNVQGKRVARSTGAIEELLKRGINVRDPEEILKPQLEPLNLEVFEKPIVDTSANINCFEIGSNNVCVEGLQQAQIISKSVLVNEFPAVIQDAIANTNLPSSSIKNIHRGILSAFVFDAYQQKLPKVNVPGKPMYNLPRIYGIPNQRKCDLLLSKLLFECDKINENSLQTRTVNDTHFDLFVKKNDDLIRLSMRADILFLNRRQIKSFATNSDGVIPDLFPMTYTIGLPTVNVSKEELNPFKGAMANYWPHIIFSYYIPEDVTNFYGVPVSTNQLEGRTLLNAFAAAYSKAKSLYGNSVKDLEKPIVVPAVQTDGKRFHFGIFQLNTLDLSESNQTKNVWYQNEMYNLFDSCEYHKGKPELNGFDPEVFKVLNVFCNKI